MSEPIIHSKFGRLFLSLMMFLWAAAVLGFYFTVHKPLTLDQTGRVLELGRTLLGWIGILVSAYWLGSRIITPSRVSHSFEGLSLRIGLGLGMISLVYLLLGYAGMYWIWLAWLLVAVGGCLGLPVLLREIPDLHVELPLRWRDRVFLGFIGLQLLLALIRALGPAATWDSLVYHLTGPKLFIQENTLNPDIDLPYLGFPLGGGMLFVLGMLLAGPALAQLIHFTFALLTLGVFLPLVRRLSAGLQWFAGAMLLGVPSAVLLASWAYVEWLTMFGTVACAFLVVDIPDQRSDSDLPGVTAGFGEGGARLILAGVFAGMALSAKYSSIGVVLGLALAVLYIGRSFKPVLRFAGGVCLFLAPYLIKNWILTGNPVFPFFLEGQGWDSLRQLWFSRPGSGLDFVRLIRAPIDATIWGIESGVVEGQPAYGATVGPYLLILIPAILLTLWKSPVENRKVILTFVIIAAIGYLTWLLQLGWSILLVQTRLLFPVLPILVVLGVYGFEGLKTIRLANFSMQFIYSGIVMFTLGLIAAVNLLEIMASPLLPYLAGEASEDDVIRASTGSHLDAMRSLEGLPENSRVVFLWEPRSFYCPAGVDCDPDSLLDRWWHLRRTGYTNQSALQEWRSQGITHVLLFERGAQHIQAEGLDPFEPEDWGELGELLTDYLQQVEIAAAGYLLYALP